MARTYIIAKQNKLAYCKRWHLRLYQSKHASICPLHKISYIIMVVVC